MGTAHQFTCIKCNYQKEDVKEGLSRSESEKQKPPRNIGTCSDCKLIFGFDWPHCPRCGEWKTTLSEKFKMLIKFKKPRTIVKFYKKNKINEIPCPVCNHKFLKSDLTYLYD